MTSSSFTTRRLQSMARIAAYALLSEFLISVLNAVLPLSGLPARQFGQVGSIIDLSTLPSIAVVLLLGGFTGSSVTGWEWRLGRGLKPLFALAALLYFLLIPANLMLASRIEATGNQELRQQFKETTKGLEQFKSLLTAAPDGRALRELMQSQPQLNQSLDTAESPFVPQAVSLDQQRSRALLLFDRLSANLANNSVRQIADSQGELRKQAFRLNLLALVHAIFFALSWLIWPRMPLNQQSADDNPQHP